MGDVITLNEMMSVKYNNSMQIIVHWRAIAKSSNVDEEFVHIPNTIFSIGKNGFPSPSV